jgi:enamine deaminase RidA (YjgF/YER057c/UK114 family)
MNEEQIKLLVEEIKNTKHNIVLQLNRLSSIESFLKQFIKTNQEEQQ